MKQAFAKGLLSARVSATAMGLGLVLAAGQTLAYTPAGTDINNRATVTYQDANGNEYSAQSNESSVTVKEVYFADLEQDGEKLGAPGETVYFSHILTNKGNSSDGYTVGAEDDDSAAAYTVYRDTNGNGVPDAGEDVVTYVSLNADEQVDLVVAVPVPANKEAGDEIDATLTVTSANGDVNDVTDAGNGADGLEGTNNDKVIVSTDAVLQLSKMASVSSAKAGDTIRYTLQLTNTGGSPATDVIIADPIPAGTTFARIVAVNGLLAGNLDDWMDENGAWQNSPGAAYPAAANLALIDEDGEDLDGSGASDGTDLPGIRFRDKEIGVNTTVTIVYEVTVDAAASAGDNIRNTFIAGVDGNGDDEPDNRNKSNTTTTTVTQVADVDVTDTGDAADDDGALNDIAKQDSAAAGAVVTFANIVANGGNGADSFDLAINNDAGAGYGGTATVPAAAVAFPSGTVFTFWDENNNVQLTDTNGNGIADTGSIDAGADRRITVRAKLPANSGATSGPYVATMVATSFGNNTISDDKLEVLGEITAPSVDLANSHPALVAAAGDGSADAFASGAPINTNDTVAVGGVATFDLFVANNSGNPQSFTLGAQLPDGWSVTFQEVGVDLDPDGSDPGLPDGTVDTGSAGTTVTSTPNLPAGAIYQYKALVQVSSVVDEALSDFVGTVDSSGENQTDGNTDSDGDYPVVFTVQSSSDVDVKDKKLDAVDVIAAPSLSVTPDGSNQVQPGGNVDYSHIIANNGNTTEEVTLTTTNSLVGDGWSSNTQLYVNSLGAWVELSNLSSGSVSVRAPNGSPITVDVDNSGADTVVTLEPGQRLDVQVTVFAPSNAPAGSVDTYTLSAAGSVSDSATDTTEVVVGQVRLNKQAAVDTDCDCSADTAFLDVQSAKVEPGQCVIWKLTATNEGATAAQNVEITDEETEFTTLQSAEDATATVASTDSGLTLSPSISLPTIQWEIGTLASGESSTASFCVEVE
ncbi:hypothetical protein [Alcanivorax sp.]|uniref:hypothetical protein n=1 Tax=Alcanivorax sp. TaxID=1872427 RepID=UPI000C0EAB7A|nr:hypothetical protein [Alcanivorax sp.]PHR64115.1 MAG: hypothetical protein COA55_14680 [Alcanivorax sp.]